MTIEFECACGKRLTAKDEFAGRRLRCPGCQSALTIPNAASKVPPVVGIDILKTAIAAMRPAAPKEAPKEASRAPQSAPAPAPPQPPPTRPAVALPVQGAAAPKSAAPADRSSASDNRTTANRTAATRVFISHSTRDRAFVEDQIVHLLRNHGLDPWYSTDDIQAGDLWQRKISEALKECDWFLVVISCDSVRSKWVQFEIAWAIQNCADRIAPILIDDSSPQDLMFYLSSIQHIDFRTDLEGAKRKLLTRFGVAGDRIIKLGPSIAERRQQRDEEDRQRREQLSKQGPGTSPRIHLMRVLERDPVPSGTDSVHVLLKLLPTGGGLHRRSWPIHHLLVVSVSPSMYLRDNCDSTRFERLQQALPGALSKLGPEDTVSIIAFAHDARVVLAATCAGTASGRDKIVNALRRADQADVDQGGHDLSEGLELALQQAESLGGWRSILVFTDDETSNESRCRTLAKRCPERKVQLTLIGVGTDWHAELIKDMARLSSGKWLYIDTKSPAASQRVIGEELEPIFIAPFSAAELHVRTMGAAVSGMWRVTPEPAVLRAQKIEPKHWTVSLGTMENETPQHFLVRLRLDIATSGLYLLGCFEVIYTGDFGQTESTGEWPVEASVGKGEAGEVRGEVARGIAAIRLFEVNDDAANLRTCPSCGSSLVPNSVACMDCGHLLIGVPSAPGGDRPKICVNTSCGVANPPDERHCRSCKVALPEFPGTVLHGRYELKKLLKIGGFAAIYLAMDLRSQKEVVIKDMICPDPAEFAIRSNFMRREVEILRALDAVPIFARVYDFIHEGALARIVMEFIRGRDLIDILEGNGNRPFAFDTVVRWGLIMCDGLTAMHSMRPPILHRDIKPDNSCFATTRRRSA